ncbi:MAG: undecaprenyl-diphosphate phosphatase [Vallitaleaceae bacterium]|nr:undecaprenyl-diphosphate phosphatase [Vallitaleaceae bacterium]
MDLLEIVKVIIIGFVEGISEWLPISSTGHMILVDEIIQLKASEAFKSMFFVVIQLGAIFAVVLLYFKKLNPLSFKKTAEEKKRTMTIWYKVLIGCLPAGILGVLLDDWLDEHLYNYITVTITLIVYGVAFILLEKKNQKKDLPIKSMEEMTYKTAFFIGVFQVLALIPGTSRSGATILGAIMLGTSRSIAAEYSFFLSIPIMFGASFLKILKFGLDFSSEELLMLITGMVVAFGVSVIAIKFLLSYVRKHDFTFFGWYRIVLGFIVAAYFALV